MSNKNLLNESQVRQFMKLAKLEPLTPGFVHGLTERGEKAGDEGSVAAGKKGDTDYSGGGERKGDKSKTHSGKDLEEGTEEELDELRTGRTGALGPKSGTHSPGHGRGQGEAPDGSMFEAEAPPGELETDAADDLEDDTLVGDEEAATDELEAGAEEGVEESRMVSVDDFLEALESALETALGDEVEVDASEVGPPEEDVAVEEPPVDVDVGLEAGEEELEEGLFGGGDKFEKMAKGKKGSYAPDPEAGEKDYTPTPEEIASARAEKGTSSRDKFPRRHSGGGGGMKIGGITAEGQDELIERVTKRVAARILKSALARK